MYTIARLLVLDLASTAVRLYARSRVRAKRTYPGTGARNCCWPQTVKRRSFWQRCTLRRTHRGHVSCIPMPTVQLQKFETKDLGPNDPHGRPRSITHTSVTDADCDVRPTVARLAVPFGRVRLPQAWSYADRPCAGCRRTFATGDA